MPRPVVFSRLNLPRPADPGAVAGLLTRLASDWVAPRIALELRADETGVRHLLGCRAGDVQRLRHLMGDLLPGTTLTGPDSGAGPARPDVEVVGQLHLRPRGVPLRTDAAGDITRALLSAASVPQRPGEAVVVQIVLGPRRSPRLLPPNALEPGTTFLQVLTRREREATPETRRRLQERLSQPGFLTAVRIGAASPDQARRHRFIMNTLGALSTARSPGVRIDIRRQRARHLNDTHLPWRWPLHLSIGELVGLLAWPITDGDLPGLPPVHPSPLRAATDVHTGRRVFARSAAPGDERLLGISASDQTMHGIAYGPSGSGKTNVLLHLITADIHAGRPVAVLDPKRQLIDDVLARVPQRRVKDVIVVNAADEAPTAFNPLDVTGRDPDVVVDGVLAAFEALFADGWGPRSADIFSAALRTLARASTPKSPATLIDLPRLLTDPAFRRRRVGRVQEDMALAGFWSWYEAQSPQAQAAAIAAPLNKMRQFLLRPALIRLLGQPDGAFQLRDVFRSNKIVLVPLNEGLIGQGTASLLGSLVIADLWQATQERADEPHADKRPGMVYIDEAPRFLHLPVSLADALAVSRSLSIGWFLAAQFRAQFPPVLRTAVDMNARSKIVFATEHDDARDTAKLTHDLTAEDFVALPRFHAYANLVAHGAPSGWALIKTLPPPPTISDPARVIAASRAAHPSPRPEPDAPNPEPESRVDDEGDAAPPPPVGRKPRRP